MANRAYLRVWTRDFSEETMIAEFARFLTTAPVAEAPNGFQVLSVQPVDYSEPAEVEWDLHEAKFGLIRRSSWKRDGTCGTLTWRR
jgi:hypothetical protein